MYKIIGADQKEYGPVSAEKLRQWLRDNRANAQTKVQAEGDEQWKALASFPEFAGELGLANEPAPPEPSLPVALTEAAYIQAVLAGDVRLDMARCLGRSWQLLKSHLGLLAGANLLIGLVLLGCVEVPVVGGFINLIITGPLQGGLYWLYLKLLRNQGADVSNAFDGFGPRFVPLMWGQIITSLLTTLSAILFLFAVALAVGFQNALAKPVVATLALIGLMPAVYLYVAWFFTLALVMDKRMDFGPAMDLSRKKVHQHWWSVFGLLVASFIFTAPAAMGFAICLAKYSLNAAHQFEAAIGMVIFGAGVLLTFPFLIGTMMCVYEELFHPPSRQTP